MALLIMALLPTIFTLFPYTTLFRSAEHPGAPVARVGAAAGRPWSDGLLWREAPGSHRADQGASGDRKSTRLNSSHRTISYAVFCLKKKNCRYCNAYL